MPVGHNEPDQQDDTFNTLFADATARRRQGITFDERHSVKSIRTDYKIDGKQFDGWEALDAEDDGFGCLWPFASCGQLGSWSRIEYLDATDRGLRDRIPYNTLCEMHWMNRGQLCLDIPEPEPVEALEWRRLDTRLHVRCRSIYCNRPAYWIYGEVVYCNQHRRVRIMAEREQPAAPHGTANWTAPLTTAVNWTIQTAAAPVGDYPEQEPIRPPGYYGEDDPR